MLKKLWMLLLAVMLVFGLVVGCGGGSDDDDNNTGEVPFEFTDFTKATYNAWGQKAPTITDDGWVFFEEVSDSSGFYINFADIGYTLKRSDIMVITYEVDVTTPNAVLLAKHKSGNNLADAFDVKSDYGRGAGREYVLDDAELSNYEVGSTYKGKTAIVEGTYDAATKTGTFEILMSGYPANADNLGFQHNPWCDMPGTKIAEDSVYKIRFTKINNKAGKAPCTCAESDPHSCDCDEDDCACVCTTCHPPAVGEVIFDLADWLEENDAIGHPFQLGGSPAVTVSATGISITDRVDTWGSGIDLLFDKVGDAPGMVIDEVKYQVTVKGTIGTAGKFVVAAPNRPWNEIGEAQVATDGGAYEIIVIIPKDFVEKEEDGTVVGLQPSIRIKPADNDALYTITELIVESIEEWEDE